MTDNAASLLPLVLTRPRRASEMFWDSLSASLQDQLRPVISPLIEIEPLPKPKNWPQAEAIVFSSANGVRCGPAGDGRPAYCVGQMTAKTATQLGWQGQYVGETSDLLVDWFAKRRKRERLVHISGVHTRGAIAERLRNLGYDIAHVTVYDQVTPEPTPQAKLLFQGQKACIVPLFSPRTALQFAKHVADASCVHIVAISASVAESLNGCQPASMVISARPDAEAMRDVLEKGGPWVEGSLG